MAWESRGGKRYYYRGRRINGRVTKIYLGSGAIAQQAAEKDAAEKTKRAKEAAELSALQASLIEPDQITTESKAGIKLLLEAELMAMGYHQHKRGEWRLRRD